MADVVGEVGGRALLNQLLVAPLGRAVALAEPQRVAVLVGQHLHLDVPGPGQVALEVDLGAAEVGLGLAGGRLHGLGGVLRGGDDLHAAPAAAVRGLDGHGPAVEVAERHDLLGRGEGLGAAGDTRDAGLLGRDAGADLVAHDLDGLGRRADEGDAALGDGAGEVGVLGEEAVAGVDPVGAALLDGVQDRLGVEVALGRRLAAEGVGLVGHADVQGVTVEVGVDGHGPDAELAARPDHPDGDFAVVCNEDLLEHAGPFLREAGLHNCTCRMVSAMSPAEWEIRWLGRGRLHEHLCP